MSSYIDFVIAHAATIFGIAVVAAIVAEKIWQRWQNRNLELNSTATSLASGAGFLVAKTIVGKGLFIALGLWIYNNHRLFDLDIMNPLVWLGVFLMRDFVYYWVHRCEHRVRALWASHLVHHSPETIGMATAVRVPWMEALYKPVFGLWLPLLGFNPIAAILFDVVAALYAQVLHTEAFAAKPKSLIGKVFVTPSAHRVHHGYNPEYLDKNFGAVLIVWDRLFGTYEPEVAPVKFGVGKTDAVNSVRDAFVGGYGRLWNDMRQADTVRGSIAIAMAPPGVKPNAARHSSTTIRRSFGGLVTFPQAKLGDISPGAAWFCRRHFSHVARDSRPRTASSRSFAPRRRGLSAAALHHGSRRGARRDHVGRRTGSAQPYDV